MTQVTNMARTIVELEARIAKLEAAMLKTVETYPYEGRFCAAALKEEA